MQRKCTLHTTLNLLFYLFNWLLARLFCRSPCHENFAFRPCYKIDITVTNNTFLPTTFFDAEIGRNKRSCILENIRQEIYAKIGGRVTVYKQLCIPVLLISRSLKIGVNFAFVRLFWQLLNLAGEPDVFFNIKSSLVEIARGRERHIFRRALSDITISLVEIVGER